jgi:low affinity Fe/Cu permease
MNNFRFSYFARRIAMLAGRPAVFLLALGAIVLWGLSGPLFGFSDTWQLVVNTTTTIITFLMVFIIQSTQNRDTEAIQLKLDELIRATQGAHNAMLDLEELEDAQLEGYRRSYRRLAQAARARLEKGELDTDSPELKQMKMRGG